jgi:hypothetical protein
MPFSPPKKNVFKQFVILDSEGAVSALSAIDGGQIDEILTRSAEEKGGSAGGEVGVGPVKGRGKKAKSRKVEEEIRKARTRHATAAKLLEALHSHESVGVVDGPLDMEVAEQIEAGMVLEFRADLRLHPVHQADQMLRSFIEIGAKLGEEISPKELKEFKEFLGPWGVITGTGRPDAPTLIQPFTSPDQIPPLLMPVPKTDFEISLDDVIGEVTVVAQVDQVLDEGDSRQVIRILRGGPASPIERQAMEEAAPKLIEGLSEATGIEISPEDIIVHGPALVLRAICAYR